MLIIRNGRVIDPASGVDEYKDVYIEDGKIQALMQPGTAPGEIPGEIPGNTSHSGAAAAEEIDAAGCIVAPGFIDTHVHFRDPGFPKKEDISSGSRAAAKGGYTSVIMMANTSPVIDSVAVLKDVLERGEKEGIHIYSAANVTLGMKGKELSDLEALAQAGARVFTDDGKPVMDASLLKEALLRAKALGLPVSLHEEDPAYITENGINAGGSAAAFLKIKGSPREAEYTMIARDLDLAVSLDAALLIQHISTKEGVELVRQAKKKNPLIAAEATPHHFSLTEDAVIRSGADAKVNPPLRTEEDRQAVITGLCDGTIAIIATDHAPHAPEEKAVQPVTAAPSGMIGLETALSLGLRELVNPGHLGMSDFLAKMTCNPAAYYHLPGGTLKEGSPADICIFDPAASWTVTDRFASRSRNSPFIGQTLPGVVRYTIAGGRIVYASEA